MINPTERPQPKLAAEFRRIITTMHAMLEGFHQRDLEFFDMPFASDPQSLESLAKTVAYYDYICWHYEDLGRTPDDATALKGYRGTIINNGARNKTIEKVDVLVHSMQKGAGEFNSETLGVIIDRLAILFLKRLHAAERGNDQAVQNLGEQIAILLHCGELLYSDVLTGLKRCTSPTVHFKSYQPKAQ